MRASRFGRVAWLVLPACLLFGAMPIFGACGRCCGGNCGPDAGSLGSDAGTTVPPDASAIVADAGWPPVVQALFAAAAAYKNGATSIDLLGDGQPAWTLLRGDGGAVLHEEIDVSNSGTPDLVWDFTSIPWTFRRQPGGVLEELVEMTPNAPAPGVASYRRTVYATDPSLPDVRASFVFDPSKPAFAIQLEQDPSHSGTFTDAGTASNTTVQYDNLPGVTVNPAGCTGTADDIQQAFLTAYARGMDCLKGMDPVAAQEFAARVTRALAGGGIPISCGSDPVDCGQASYWPWMWYQQFNASGIGITLFPSAFNPSDCGSVAATVFHEILHYVYGDHPPTGSGLPDRVTGCDTQCFGAATPQSCADCLATTTSDPRCSGAADSGSRSGGYNCPCNSTVYCVEQTCVNNCIATIGCFSGICSPVPLGDGGCSP